MEVWYNYTVDKMCKSCNQVLNLNDFHKRSAAKDGRQSVCKSCNCKQRSAYYKTAAGKQSNIVSGKRWVASQLKKVYDYLSTHPCVDCGESDPVVLEFDHDDPSTKLFTIGSTVGDVSQKTLFEEISKCSVRCANCHRRKTAKQFNWYNKFMAL
jgi:hypothetical protein